ncbi:S41 family peptidase [Pedobacter sp. B4-66]|uniref:S41 family peptidase n=1 Tax=Pedobacter sp. B4-66 TaxID=2817280 RepID=UPI001BDAEFEC|nr:S41 family peptidase [Pedobacter sp. B4-66]
MLLAIFAGSLVACKKSALSDDEKNETPRDGTREQLILDSIYLYTKHTYLWNDVLPKYDVFNPRKYITANSELLNFKKELYDISQYKINPLTLHPYEKTALSGLSKYSYLADESNGIGLKAALNYSESTTVSALVSGSFGYLKISQFPHLSELSVPLNEAFSAFSSSGITSLIVDLRNNPGGYVETAQYLANLIAVPAMNDKVMYTEHFNSEMQAGNVSILKKQPYLDENNQPVFINGRRATYADVDFSVVGNTFLFKNAGQLNTITNLYFLVNGGTASASELLINALKPYFNVLLIGEQTYGKPVGSFGIKIDNYTLYAVSFQIKNAKGEGDYFNGLSPEIIATDEKIGDAPDFAFASTLVLISKPNAKEVMVPVVSFSSGKTEFVKPEMIKEKLKLR